MDVVQLKTAITRPSVQCTASYRPGFESRNDYPVRGGGIVQAVPGMKVLLTMFHKTQRSEGAESSERSSLRRTVKPAMANVYNREISDE